MLRNRKSRRGSSATAVAKPNEDEAYQLAEVESFDHACLCHSSTDAWQERADCDLSIPDCASEHAGGAQLEVARGTKRCASD